MALLSDYLGRLHPLLLHFPIALLWTAAVAETCRVRRESAFLSRMVVWLLGAGALSAVAAAGSGWLLAAHEHIRQDQQATLFWHRWLGVATATLTLPAWLAAHRWRETAVRRQQWQRHVLVWLATVVLTVAAHLGALLVWGADWLT